MKELLIVALVLTANNHLQANTTPTSTYKKWLEDTRKKALPVLARISVAIDSKIFRNSPNWKTYALKQAIAHKDIHKLQALIDAGADVNKPIVLCKDKSITPLLYGSISSYTGSTYSAEIIRILVNA
jgi:hypothetical protein